jgi:uncharacterized protein (UPF0332 family)
MSHAQNKVEWCLKKAERELKESNKHRGLIKAGSDLEKAKDYTTKAEHYLKATEYLKKGNFSDISASTVFYSMYHCLMAIAIKFGYESKNQECTFALIYSLIEDNKISIEKELLDKITSLEIQETDETITSNIREKYQYGTELSIKDDKLYRKLLELAKLILSKTKLIIKA